MQYRNKEHEEITQIHAHTQPIFTHQDYNIPQLHLHTNNKPLIIIKLSGTFKQLIQGALDK